MPGYFASVLLQLLRLSSIPYKPSFFTEIVNFKATVVPQNFGYLKTTFNVDPSKGFIDEPRLRSEAKDQGWTLLGDGCRKKKFPYPGFFMIQRFNARKNRGGEMALIYDGNGYIAGVSIVIPIKNATYPDTRFFQHSYYQKVPDRDGNMNIMSTVYFVHPSKVCPGRTQEEFEKQGTGTGIYIVTGPSVKNLLPAPLYRPYANTKHFFKGFCRTNIGQNYYIVDFKKPNFLGPNCTKSPPLRVLYATKPPYPLIGVVYGVPTIPDGNRWEIPQPLHLKFIPYVPKCAFELIKKGSRLLHVFIGNYQQTCPKKPKLAPTLEIDG